MIRDHWLEFAEAIADLGADPNIGALNAYTNTTYFNPDGIHQKDAGYVIVGGIVQAAINNLILGYNKLRVINGALNWVGGAGTVTPLAPA